MILTPEAYMNTNTLSTALNLILKEHATVRTNGRVASDRTTTSYGEVLHLAFETLTTLGYRIQNPENLRDVHVAALCQHWYSNGKKPSTIREYLSKLRIFAGWMGKKGLVKSLPAYLPHVDKNLLKVSKITADSKGWSEKALCRFVWKLTSGSMQGNAEIQRHGGAQRIGR